MSFYIKYYIVIFFFLYINIYNFHSRVEILNIKFYFIVLFSLLLSPLLVSFVHFSFLRNIVMCFSFYLFLFPFSLP
jgi:hypothetical protein